MLAPLLTREFVRVRLAEPARSTPSNSPLKEDEPDRHTHFRPWATSIPTLEKIKTERKNHPTVIAIMMG